MSELVWLKQSKDKPLFENLLWSRPENKARAGKLLIVGGNLHGFSAPANAYNLASKAGAGAMKVLLPDSLRSSVGRHLEDAIYCPSNKSGSFSHQSLTELMDYAAWADLTLLAGDFGHNSETAILIESFLKDYKGLVCLSDDGLDPFLSSPNVLFERPDNLIVADFSKLQKLVLQTKTTRAITSSMSLLQLVEVLSDLSINYRVSIITYHDKHFIASVNGKISTTEAKDNLSNWHIALASYSSVWWMQNASNTFEALTTAIYSLQE